MTEKSNKELLDELGIDTAAAIKPPRSPREERIIAGFEEILRFTEEHGHAPDHGEDRDIFERRYATRLDRIRSQHEWRTLLSDMDHYGLLERSPKVKEPLTDYRSDKEILAELGVDPSNDAPREDDITLLKHVKPRTEIRAAEEIARRIRCKDFEKYAPLFDLVQQDLNTGVRQAKHLTSMAKINQGDWFILGGQKVYVERLSDERIHGFDKSDYRLRVIYDNGTESALLLRSLQIALYKDEAGRRITDPSPGPLFAAVSDEGDLLSGTIYVLRSHSEHSAIQKSRDTIHKIGVTGGSVQKRIANAKLDPTYLMAEVEVVATYELYNINHIKLEHLIHQFFENARLDIQIPDRFGKLITPREWFLVPLFVIDEVVEKIKDETISQYCYDVESASLVSAFRE